jgi:hypothetical protein
LLDAGAPPPSPFAGTWTSNSQTVSQQCQFNNVFNGLTLDAMTYKITELTRDTITLEAWPTTNNNDFYLVHTWTVLAVSGTSATTSNIEDSPCLGVASSCTLTLTEFGGTNAGNDAGLDGSVDGSGARASSLGLEINAQWHDLNAGTCTVAGTLPLTAQ